MCKHLTWGFGISELVLTANLQNTTYWTPFLVYYVYSYIHSGGNKDENPAGDTWNLHVAERN